MSIELIPKPFMAFMKSRNWPLVGVMVALVSVRIPFILSGYIQEDAFITWRTSETLLHAGFIGFNPLLGEKVSSSTSHLYVGISALFQAVFGDSFIVPVLLFNSFLLILSIWFLTSHFESSKERRMVMLMVAAVLPVSLRISYSGMETSIVLLLFSVCLNQLSSARNPGISFPSFFLLPWARPDAVSLALLSIAAVMAVRRTVPYWSIFGTVFGLASMFCFNKLYFGEYVHHTIIAKGTDLSLPNMVRRFPENLAFLFLKSSDGGIFSLFESKYGSRLAPFFTALALFSIVWVTASLRKTRATSGETLPHAVLIGCVFLVPAAYALGGILFPWYFWISAQTAMMYIAKAVVDSPIRKTVPVYVGLTSLLVLLASGHFALAFSRGTQESGFRASVGKYLKSVANPSETLFLEPAGYIPYYSGLTTHDEVGLVSPIVTKYKKKYGDGWWMEFLRREKPSFLVQRDHILEYSTYEGYRLTPEERSWFDGNYELIRTFRYNPEDFVSNAALLRLAQFGNHSSYHVFRRRQASSTVKE